jgi:hypothetical protein
VSNATKVTALTARSLVAGRRFKRAAPINFQNDSQNALAS